MIYYMTGQFHNNTSVCFSYSLLWRRMTLGCITSDFLYVYRVSINVLYFCCKRKCEMLCKNRVGVMHIVFAELYIFIFRYMCGTNKQYVFNFSRCGWWSETFTSNFINDYIWRIQMAGKFSLYSSSLLSQQTISIPIQLFSPSLT